MNVKVISLPYIFQVLYVLCFTRPRYQVSVYRTIGPLVRISGYDEDFFSILPYMGVLAILVGMYSGSAIFVSQSQGRFACNLDMSGQAGFENKMFEINGYIYIHVYSPGAETGNSKGSEFLYKN